MDSFIDNLIRPMAGAVSAFIFCAVRINATAVSGTFGIGNMFQSNQAAAIIISTSGGATSPFAGNAWVLGVIQALLLGVVIIEPDTFLD